MEMWDVLNNEGQPTGRKIARGNISLRAGEFHLVVHIWPIAPDGRLLIQRRSPKKRLMPGEWAATGGAAIAGELSIDAAARELFEELGIRSNSLTLDRIQRIKRKNSFVDVWAIKTDVAAENLRLQRSEVAEAKWVTEEELLRMVADNEFHNYGKEYFETILHYVKSTKGANV